MAVVSAATPVVVSRTANVAGPVRREEKVGFVDPTKNDAANENGEQSGAGGVSVVAGLRSRARRRR